MRATPFVVMASLALGCGSGDDETPIVAPPTGCAAGTWPRDDGSCVPAGLPPDLPCPPGEWLRDDGVCVPAGVPPDACGEGFVHDGDRGCEPILPAAPCRAGQMAVPGERNCREVAPCASGKWGDIPIEPDSEHVDGSYTGLDSDGSALKPWATIQAAVDAASPGAIVAIAAGSYVEDISVDGKPVRLWAVCPRLVEVVGTGAELAAVLVADGTAGTEVRNLAIRGGAFGFGSSGSLDVLIEHVWVHDNASQGVNAQNDLGPTSITLRASLVEQNHHFGVFVAGATATVETSVVRGTQPDAQGLAGVGVGAIAHPTTRASSTLRLRTSLVDRNREFGVFVDGSELIAEASVLRETQSNAEGLLGRGLGVEASANTGAPSRMQLRTSLLERNHEVGLGIDGSEASVETSVVRQTQPEAEGVGLGILARGDPMTGAPSTLQLRTSLVEQNHTTGVLVAGSKATVEASVVRETLRNESQIIGHGMSLQAHSTTGAPSTLQLRTSLLQHNAVAGLFVHGSEATVEASVVRENMVRGVEVQHDSTTGASSALQLRASLVEQNYATGVLVDGSDATVEATVVRQTQLNAQGLRGRGINAQSNDTTGAPSTLALARSIIEQSHEGGVFIIGSMATIEGCLVRDTLPNGEAEGGSGILVLSGTGPASAIITATRTERSALAAVAAWGAHAALGSSALVCQAFDFDYETYQGNAATLEDLGDNLCGCPEATAACKAVSAGLEPPPPLD